MNATTFRTACGAGNDAQADLTLADAKRLRDHLERAIGYAEGGAA